MRIHEIACTHTHAHTGNGAHKHNGPFTMSIAVDIRVFYVYVIHRTTRKWNFIIEAIGEWQLENIRQI